MSEAADVLTFGPPEEVSEDTPPRKVPTCEVCGTDLEYGGRGRPPTRCPEHRKGTPSTPGTTGQGRRAPSTKANREAAELAAKLDRGMSKASVFVAPFDIYDAGAIFAAKGPIVEQYEAVLATHDAWRLWAKEMGGTGSVAGLIVAVAIGAAPIAAHHGLIPARVGKFPVGEALQMLPQIMLRLQKAAETGDDVLQEYLTRMAKPETRTTPPKGPSS